MKNSVKTMCLIVSGIIFSLVIMYSCSEKKGRITKSQEDSIRNRMMNINKLLVSMDADSIRKIVEKNKWGLTQTPTGLWHRVYHVGSGDSVKSGKVVTLSYNLKMLDGTIVYTSDSLGLKTFIVGRGGVESGLEEGIRLMKMGDSARFILPPYLAHGLIGDQNKVPRLAILLYDITVQSVESLE